jgi:hypothetical protein
MNQKFHNNKGSAMVWVLILCVIFGILGVAIGWVALSMNKRSVNNYILKQDYFTSRSAIDTIVDNLNGLAASEKYSGSMCEYLNNNLVNGDKTVSFADFFASATTDTQEIKNMGSCRLTGNYANGVISLNAVTGSEQDGKVSATLERKCVDSSVFTYTDSDGKTQSINIDHKQWPNERFADELTSNGTTISVGKQTETNRNLNVAVYTVSANKTVAGKLDIEKDAATEKKAVFIYIKSGGTLDLNGMTDNTEKTWFENVGDWNTYHGPDIYIYLEGTQGSPATLNFSAYNNNSKDVPYPLYITGKDSTYSRVTGSTGVKVFYQTGVNNLANIPSFSGAPSHLPVSGYYYTGAPATTTSADTGLMADQWSVIKYTNGE